MCGVHGIITHSFSEDEVYRKLEDMGVLQVHRGPDDRKETVFSLKREYWVLGSGGFQSLILKRNAADYIA